MTDPFELGPELRGLLAELVERPERAGLLRKHVAFRELLSTEPLGIGRSLGSDARERHLLQAHREELARLLLQASQWMAFAGNRPFLEPRDERGRRQGLRIEGWRQRSEAQLRSSAGTGQAHGALDLLRRALEPGSLGSPTPRELAVASMRLVPRTEALIAVGTRLSREGEPLRARELYERALVGCSSGFLAGIIWQNLSAAFCKLGRFDDAVESARRAAHLAPEPQQAAIAWFCAATQAGHDSERKRSASCLRDVVPEDSDQLAEYIACMRAGRASGEWSPTRDATLLATRYDPKLPSAAEMILEAFC